MKPTFVLAAITLALAASSVAAAERLPEKLVGNWCLVDPPKLEGESIYNRTTTQCPPGTLTRQKIRIDGMDGQDGTDGPSGKCQLLRMVVIKSDDYLAKFRCNTEGHISNDVYRLTLKGNRLVMITEKANPEQGEVATKRLSCSPRDTTARILAAPLPNALHRDWTGQSNIGTSWSLEVKYPQIIDEADNHYLRGDLISPRGGLVNKDVFVLEKEWQCSVVDEKAEETTQADHANDPAPSVDKHCVVVDPTSTPLNVRTSPNGRIVGTVANGVAVSILDRSVDNRGKPWVYIGEYSSRKPVGWVFREFIACL